MILVLNCGSQSIKWKVFDANLRPIKFGKIKVLATDDYKKMLRQELEKIRGFRIQSVGHRVVHGGGIFSKPLRLSPENLVDLEKISRFAPLHNPFNILGIKMSTEVFKNAPQFAVFDTEFFAELPEVARTYALPENISRDFSFRRYGFHGVSHEYVAKKAAEKLGKPFDNLRVITCHLGGGSSVAAIRNGKAIDTSMGFTPLEGVVMMTRPGNIDTGIVLELAKKFGVEKAGEILNKESGLKGICREGEMLKVFEKINQGDKKAKLAFDIFVYSAKKYIGAYFAILGGCDILVFTGSIGSGLPKTRNAVLKDLKILDKTKIMAIETDEELAIALKIKNNLQNEKYTLVQ